MQKLMRLLLFTFLVGGALGGSCVGRCGEVASSGACGCDRHCGSSCCSDYKTVCYSCQDRCDAAYDEDNLACQCSELCRDNMNCCSDYTALCDGGETPVLTDEVLKSFTNTLSLADTNGIKEGSGGFTIDLQGKVSSGSHNDNAPKPLMKLAASLSAETYKTFERLRNNYSPNVQIDDTPSSNQDQEVDDFLDAVMKTEIMIKLEEFVAKYDLLSSSTTLKAKMKKIWFTTYPRGGTPYYIKGSSGFEHVFIGEVDGDDIGGFHNWVSYTREEEAQRADYRGYIKDPVILGNSAGYVLKNSFTWVEGSEKSTGGYTIGPSIEYDLAVYTLCWMARPNGYCKVQSNGVSYSVKTYDFTWDGEKLVGTAYPSI